MTQEQLHKANKLNKEMEAINTTMNKFNEAKFRTIRLGFDGIPTTVYIPEDIKEFVLAMVEASYEKRLKDIQK